MLRAPCEWEAVSQSLDKLRLHRGAVDLPELILVWLAFVWATGKTSNPLLEGRGVPSAVLLDVVLGAPGVDLSPGAVQRASCPELVWQAARWWQAFTRAPTPLASAGTTARRTAWSREAATEPTPRRGTEPLRRPEAAAERAAAALPVRHARRRVPRGRIRARERLC